MTKHLFLAAAVALTVGFAPAVVAQDHSHHTAPTVSPGAVGTPVTVGPPTIGGYLGCTSARSIPTFGRVVTGPAVRVVQPSTSATRGKQDCCKRNNPSCCPQRYCCIVK